ncbi:S12A6 protein, partial [Amazona guildingii]|nr:S12A6 protein [Amazona guildingii]
LPAGRAHGACRQGPWCRAARRPQLLVLLKLDEELRPRQPQVLALAAQLQAGKGLTVVGTVIPGELPREQPRARAAEQVGAYG